MPALGRLLVLACSLMACEAKETWADQPINGTEHCLEVDVENNAVHRRLLWASIPGRAPPPSGFPVYVSLVTDPFAFGESTSSCPARLSDSGVFTSIRACAMCSFPFHWAASLFVHAAATKRLFLRCSFILLGHAPGPPRSDCGIVTSPAIFDVIKPFGALDSPRLVIEPPGRPSCFNSNGSWRNDGMNNTLCFFDSRAG